MENNNPNQHPRPQPVPVNVNYIGSKMSSKREVSATYSYIDPFHHADLSFPSDGGKMFPGYAGSDDDLPFERLSQW